MFGNAPKMLWTDCPDDDACDKCLDVAFESGNDIACLNEKFPETKCILEGNFMNGGARIFVSSEQCINGGDMNHIQVTKVLHMCFNRLPLAFESCDLSQADKSIKRVFSFPN